MYNAAALGIVFLIKENKQLIFNKHIDDVTAIDINPVSKNIIATGEIGPKPNIFVWDANTLETLQNFR